MKRAIFPLLLLAGVVGGGDDAAATAARVKELLGQGRWPGAAQALGSAFARAQRSGDLVLEQDLVAVLEEQFGSLDPLGDPAPEGGYRDVCRELMKKLEAGRGGACLSAHNLAYEIMFQCVRSGDDRHLKEAARVATTYAHDASIPIGPLWEKYPVGKEIVTVSLSSSTFEIAHGYSDYKKSLARKGLVLRQANGGVAVTLYEAGVGFAGVDLVDSPDAVAATVVPKRWQVLYQLKGGETWSLSKRGVTIR